MTRRIFFSLLFISTLAAAGSRPPVAVSVGGDDTLDACGGAGEVRGLGEGKGKRLSVRSGPGNDYSAIDKLYERQTVFMCGESRDHQWLGIVYSHTDDEDCGVTSPINPAQPYAGTCSSGWVPKGSIVLIAE